MLSSKEFLKIMFHKLIRRWEVQKLCCKVKRTWQLGMSVNLIITVRHLPEYSYTVVLQSMQLNLIIWQKRYRLRIWAKECQINRCMVRFLLQEEEEEEMYYCQNSNNQGGMTLALKWTHFWTKGMGQGQLFLKWATNQVIWLMILEQLHSSQEPEITPSKFKIIIIIMV